VRFWQAVREGHKKRHQISMSLAKAANSSIVEE
jgi:hypothetical protein